MTIDITFPELVIEVHRYDDPDTYRFFFVEPNPVDYNSINYHPFRTPNGLGPNYVESNRMQIKPDMAEVQRSNLTEKGYHPMTLREVPIVVWAWCTHSMCPIEWHQGLDEMDERLMSRVIVWVNGTFPEVWED